MSVRWGQVARAAWVIAPPLFFIKDRLLWVYCVEGRSMEPTLNPQDTFLNRRFRDWVLVQKNADLLCGDVVVLRDPQTNCQIVKRLVAQEHEFVPQKGGGYYCVPPGHCWVEGDNVQLSVDSRSFGPVSLGLVDAVVVAVLWPFWRARRVDGHAPGG
mmetsp:Transcript_71842/g.166219  ORF Transcript_71842/g.166219 Transcript_71842/m.166219 type:complete len:157 (+) Transcript_71842:102-572(+)